MYSLWVEVASQAYSVTAISNMFFGSLVMMIWWVALVAGVFCFRGGMTLLRPLMC